MPISASTSTTQPSRAVPLAIAWTCLSACSGGGGAEGDAAAQAAAMATALPVASVAASAPTADTTETAEPPGTTALPAATPATLPVVAAPPPVSVCAASTPGNGTRPYALPAAPAPGPLVDGLYQRPEGSALALVGTNDGVANRFVEPFVGALGGRYLLFHAGSHATLQGQGYMRVRWELAYFNRGGLITSATAPNFEVLSGRLTKVALAGRYMPDPVMDDLPGLSGTWEPGWQRPGVEYMPFTAAPDVGMGMPSLWVNEYYHLDGTLKVTSREVGTDYNLSLTPVTWADVRSDLLGTRPRAAPTIARAAVALDPYAGDVPPASPVSLAATVIDGSTLDLSWTDCADNERGFLIEASRAGSFGGPSAGTVAKAYAAGELFTTVESLPADSAAVRLATLAPSTRYLLRIKAHNAAGDSAWSNTVEVTTPPAGAAPSAPWTASDVLAVGATMAVPGSSVRSDDRYTLKVGSADLWGNADSFHFVHQPLQGDGSITARVLDLAQTAATAKAGVMIRASLAANAPYAMSRVYANGVVQGQRRNSNGGGSFAEGSAMAGGLGSAPSWLRLTRRGNVFTAEGSADGVVWTTLSTRTIAMGAQTYVGLAYASLGGKPGTATFDHVTVTSP